MKCKRLFTLLLSLCIVVGSFVAVSAGTVTTNVAVTPGLPVTVDEIPSPTEVTTITVGNVNAKPGKEISVPVSISNNAVITGLTIEIRYDSNALTLQGAAKGEALGSMHMTKPGDMSANPVTFLWDNMKSDNSNGVILLLTFKVADEAVEGEYEVGVTVKTACDSSMKDIETKVERGKVTVANFIPGDANEDDVVDVDDIDASRKFIAGGYSIDVNERAVDVDADSEHTAKDIILLKRFVAGGYGVTLK